LTVEVCSLQVVMWQLVSMLHYSQMQHTTVSFIPGKRKTAGCLFVASAAVSVGSEASIMTAHKTFRIGCR